MYQTEILKAGGCEELGISLSYHQIEQFFDVLRKSD